MGELMPDNLQRAVTQMTYFLPTLKNLHVLDDDAATMMIALSRFGFGKGKGGTSPKNLASAALGPLQLTHHAQAGKEAYLKALGVVDAKGNSEYFTDMGGNLFGFLDQLAAYEAKHGSITAQKTFEGAFGKVGYRLADLLADPVISPSSARRRHAAEVARFAIAAELDLRLGRLRELEAAKDMHALSIEVMAVGGYALSLYDTLHKLNAWIYNLPFIPKAPIDHTGDPRYDLSKSPKYLQDHRAHGLTMGPVARSPWDNIRDGIWNWTNTHAMAVTPRRYHR